MSTINRRTDQQNNQSREAVSEFDVSRAMLRDKDIFSPFYVKATRPLREALARGDIHDDTLVLVMENKVGTLALLTQQMIYHHVAQGEMTAQPWMVVF